MSTFKEIAGRNIRSYTTNPDNPLEGQMWYNQTDLALKGVVASAAWSSASPLTTAREGSAAFGAQTTAVICGGETPSVSGATEEYNGSGFSAGGGMNTARYRQGAAGISTAGIIFGGYIAPNTNATEEYDGSTWTTSPGSLNTARNALAGAGIQTSALAFGGTTIPNFLNSTEEYNGTSWTAVNNLNTGRRSIMGSGANAEECLAFGGEVSSPPAVATANTESWNGTSWTEVNNLNTARYGGYGAGTQTAAILAGGIVGPGTMQSATETWDGTNWTTSPVSLATARGRLSVAGTQTAAIAMSGQTPSITTATEEYNKSITVYTSAAWSSGGTFPYGSGGVTGFGGQTTAVGLGGESAPGPVVNTVSHYDGSSWTSATNYPSNVRNAGPTGTQTAGLVVGGNTAPGATPTINTVNEYDGSTWTAGGSYPAVGSSVGVSGIQTAALGSGGYFTPGGSPGSTAVNIYNGSSWTGGTAMNNARYSHGCSGSTTASLVFGGAPGKGLTVEDWNGTSWTALSNKNIDTPTAYSTSKTGVTADSAYLFSSPPSFPGYATELFNGIAFQTAPSLASPRFAGSAGTPTAALAFSGYAGPGNPRSTVTEEFNEGTVTTNVKTFTTS